MKKIVDYLDYRDFLNDYYVMKKGENPLFSYRLFGRMVAVDHSHLAKVLIKQRQIAGKSIKNFSAFFKFNKQEAEFFETLIYFAKAKSEKQSKLYFEKLLSFKDVPSNTIREEQYEFYKKWYYSTIRSLLEFYEFNGDYKELSEQLSPAISVKEAKQAIKLLLKLGLIVKDAQGKYTLSDKAITTGREWRSIAIQSFQEETIGLAKETLQRHPKEARDVSTITMNITRENLSVIREMAREFRSSVIRYVNGCSGPDSVYQMNLQIYPLTNTKRNKK